MSIGPKGKGTRAISKNYPVTDGLTAETTTQTGHQERLIPQMKSNVSKKDRAGFS